MSDQETYPFFCYAYWNEKPHKGFWFRICGYGLLFAKRGPTFSERYGYKKSVKIFGWYVKTLKKEPYEHD